jgi:hypothetical protein
MSDHGQQPREQEGPGEGGDVEGIHFEDERFRKENFISESRHRELRAGSNPRVDQVSFCLKIQSKNGFIN